jgi:hypothetical protein
MNRASIVHLSAPVTLGDLMPQVGQRDVGAKLRDQISLVVLARNAHRSHDKRTDVEKFTHAFAFASGRYLPPDFCGNRVVLRLQ